MKYTPLIPPFIDIDDLNMARSLLKDRVLYIKTPMWYNEKSEAIEGRKLIPVRVVDIRPGNNVLPVEVWFEDDKGNQAGVFMSLLSSSRSQSAFAVQGNTGRCLGANYVGKSKNGYDEGRM